jgi:hypothetical protein
MSIDNQDIKQLITILQKMLSDNEDEQTNSSSEESNTLPVRTLKTHNKKMSSTKHYNKFMDMPEKNMHKEDTEIDKRLSKGEPTPRTRSFNFVDVICRICGKKESISPALVDSISRYKCNTCSTSSG